MLTRNSQPVATDNDRHDVFTGTVLYFCGPSNEVPNCMHAALGAHDVDGGVAEVGYHQVGQRVHHGVHMRLAGAITAVNMRVTHRIRPMSGAARAGTHVGHSANNRYIDLAGLEIGGRHRHRRVEEGRHRVVTHAKFVFLQIDDPGLALGIFTQIAQRVPDVIAGIAGVQGDDRLFPLANRCGVQFVLVSQQALGPGRSNPLPRRSGQTWASGS